MLIVWDGNNLFRRCLATPKFASLTDRKGKPSGGLYGTVTIILKQISLYRPTHCVVAFDGRDAKSIKQKKYAGYKAHRASKGLALPISGKVNPEEAAHHSMTVAEVEQMENTILLLRALGLKVFYESELDADDIIGTLVRCSELKPVTPKLIVSNDKDFMQLLNSDTRQLRSGDIITDTQVSNILGVTPKQVPEYLALCGDAVDGIPGLQGCGPKTAANLLSTYSSFKGIVSSDSPWGKKMKVEKKRLLAFRSLTRINCKVLSPQLRSNLALEAKPQKYKQPDLDKLVERFGLGSVRAWVETHPTGLLDNRNELF